MPNKYSVFSDQLRPGEYAHNIRVVIAMWKYIFGQYPDLLRRYVQEVKVIHTVTDYPGIYYSQAVDTPLNKMTQKKFLEMLKFIDEHAQKFVGCREG
jgi:hypothetical protein